MIAGYERPPTQDDVDLSHGRFLHIDLLGANVKEARGRYDTEHASLDVKFADALGASSAFKSIRSIL